MSKLSPSRNRHMFITNNAIVQVFKIIPENRSSVHDTHTSLPFFPREFNICYTYRF